MEEAKQTAKGDNINQIIVQGNYIAGLDEDAVIALIEKHRVVDAKEIIKIVHEVIKDIPEDKRAMPDRRIFIPTLQQLSYCYEDETLKETFKKLLFSSMNSDKCATVHPSFVNILSQLNSDEVRILNILPISLMNSHPLINLRRVEKGASNQGIIIINNFSNIGYGLCRNPHDIGSYLNNLQRLGLIDIPEDLYLVDKTRYDALKAHPLIDKLKQDNGQGNEKFEFQFDEKLFRLTLFGIHFLQCCK